MRPVDGRPRERGKWLRCGVLGRTGRRFLALGQRRRQRRPQARRLASSGRSRPGFLLASWEPFVAADERPGLGVADLFDRAAFERRHWGAGIAYGLLLPDAALVGDGGEDRSSAGAIGALTAGARAETAGGAAPIDKFAAGAAGGRDLGPGTSPHGRAGLRATQPGGGSARDANSGRAHHWRASLPMSLGFGQVAVGRSSTPHFHGASATSPLR